MCLLDVEGSNPRWLSIHLKCTVVLIIMRCLAISICFCSLHAWMTLVCCCFIQQFKIAPSKPLVLSQSNKVSPNLLCLHLIWYFTPWQRKQDCLGNMEVFPRAHDDWCFHQPTHAKWVNWSVQCANIEVNYVGHAGNIFSLDNSSNEAALQQLQLAFATMQPGQHSIWNHA